MALRERHNLTHKETNQQLKVGDVVLIKSDFKNRGTWPMGIIESLHPGKDGVVWAVRIRTSNGRVNPEVAEFRPRPQRKAAQVATETLKNTADYESEEI